MERKSSTTTEEMDIGIEPLKLLDEHPEHDRHLCHIMNLRNVKTAAKLSKGAEYICFICGRAAKSDKNLCQPVKI